MIDELDEPLTLPLKTWAVTGTNGSNGPIGQTGVPGVIGPQCPSGFEFKLEDLRKAIDMLKEHGAMAEAPRPARPQLSYEDQLLLANKRRLALMKA